MSFSFTKKRRSEIVLIFDIGSASVGVAYVLLSPKGPEVLYTKRSSLPISERVTTDSLLASTSATLKELVAMLQKEKVGLFEALKMKAPRIKNIFCVFSSPWSVSHTKTLHIKKETPVLVTRDMIDGVVSKERQEFEQTITNLPYAHTFSSGVELLEQKIIRIKIDGYTVANPYGKKTQDLELSFFESFVSKQILQRFNEIIGQSFGHGVVQFHTFGLVSYSSLSDLFPDEGTFLCMDITGEVTDISLVKNDVLFESVSFPSGRNFLIRTIMKKTNTNPEIALSYAKMHVEKHIEPKIAVAVAEAVKSAREEWLAYLNDILSDIAKSSTFSKKIFVTVDDDVSQIFLDFLKNSTPPLSPVLVHSKNLDEAVQLSKRVRFDSFISLEALFFNKIFSLHDK